jgi:diacylglycerol kinase
VVIPSEPPAPRRSSNRAASFRYAFAGWAALLLNEPNTRIHAAFTAAALVLGVWLRLDPGSWALVLLVTGMVWMAELFNTAVEAAVDVASPEVHPVAKLGKDAAAGAVLAAAVTAVGVGLLVFGPPLVERLWPLAEGLFD